MIEGIPAWLSHLIILLGLVYASYTDLRTREVPDILNYTLIASGVLIASVASVFLQTITPLYHSVAGLIVGYLLGALMFYTGQWGGGDAKMLMAVGAFQGFAVGQLISGSIPLLLTVFLSFLFVGAIYSLFYVAGLIITNWRLVVEEFHRRFTASQIMLLRVGSASVILLVAGLFVVIPSTAERWLFLVILLFIVLSYVMFLFGKIVEQSVLVKSVPLKDVTVGDWIVEDVHVDGKRVCGPKDLGISKQQIDTLKRHSVCAVKVKYGIPFIPGFLFGYVLVLILGNWLEKLIALL